MSGETFFGGSGHFRGVAAATQLTKDAQRFEVKFVWLPKRNPLHNQKRRISENLGSRRQSAEFRRCSPPGPVGLLN
jgi:hypothetical protein